MNKRIALLPDTFLTSTEVAELTGIKIGRKISGQSIRREQLQANWLRSVGVPFYLNARGLPIILRANLVRNSFPDDLPKCAWQSLATLDL